MQEQQKSGWKRINSGAYWDAEQWDPDQRGELRRANVATMQSSPRELFLPGVYVGAEAGLKNHLQASF